MWAFGYAPLARAVGAVATVMNHLQFLTIRRYLGLVFITLVSLLLVLAVWGMIADLLAQLGQMALVLALAPAVTGLIRKMKARLQRRTGPPIIQPYRDLRRLLGKEVVLGDTTSWLFRAAPYVVFAATWVAAALVPTFQTGLLFSWSGDLIAIVALLGLARFVQAIAALDSGTPFGGLGASREVMIASLAEPAMTMVIFTVALVAGSSQLSTIANFMVTTGGLRVSLAMALVALVIVALAENARIPFDNPATHLELTMVHEAMVLEYSGRHLAMIELAGSLRLLLYISLIACMFVPFGLIAGGAGLPALTVALAAYVLKLGIASLVLATLETSVAKLRVFRTPNLLGIALMLRPSGHPAAVRRGGHVTPPGVRGAPAR